jgi:hypothetical protein
MNVRTCVWWGGLMLVAIQCVGQTIHHWETVVYDSMKWRYWPGTSAPGANWQTPAFNDQLWQEGRGGLGYGDGDDRTVISPVISVFLRRKFTITNRDKIKDALLHIDYDDGYIAYLNGVEVARAFMPAGTAPFNQASAGLHEAVLYQGQAPEGILIRKEQLEGLLTVGENTLAIQVHNENISSSDLTARVFFSVGITDNSGQTYLPTPSWFTGPLDFSSNLPIIVINTNGQFIQDDPRIVAHMGIIDQGAGIPNRLSDSFTNYDGRITIETRGESSQGFPKKSYSIETQKADGSNFNASLLGMPPENDWILYAPYTDKTMMRDVLAYQLGRDMGRYAPRTRFAEVVINDDYKGVYVLIERIKRDISRVDIATLQPGDVSGDELTGGYILRVDKLDGNDYPGWTATPTPLLAGENDITFQYFDPAGEELVEAQRNYIRNYMRSFQNALTTATFTNNTTGFKSFLDLPSTIDFMLVNEIGKNIDGFVFSTYLYKEKDSDGGKLHLGPLWDFNLAFGNVDYLANAQFAPGWMWNDQYRMFWFRRMMQDPAFADQMKCRWTRLRTSFLTDQYFPNKIDSIAAVLNAAQQRNYTRWPILGTYVWPNQFVGATYADELNFLKTWIQQRLDWMDANLPGECNLITAVRPENGVRIYPNPFTETLIVEVDNPLTVTSFEVLDVTGRVVFQESFHQQMEWSAVNQSASRMAKGVYVVRVTQADTVTVQRVVVQ